MKKIIAALLLSTVITSAAVAAETTYSGQFTKKIDGKLNQVTAKEQKLRDEQKARETAAQKAKQNQNDAAKKHQEKVQTKKKQLKDLTTY